jgi:hypothetical protein
MLTGLDIELFQDLVVSVPCVQVLGADLAVLQSLERLNIPLST